MILYYVDISHTHWYATLAEAKKAARISADEGQEVTVGKVKIADTKSAIVNLANMRDCTGDVVYVAKPKRGEE
jgi:hypothetical protein